MVYLVPSRAGRVTPAESRASAAASALFSSGTDSRRSICSATLCMVLVQMTMKSAPPFSRFCAAAPSSSALLSQSPADWQASIS